MAKLLLVRHAERPDIPANTVGNEVLLTDKGKEDTRNFARSISDPVVSIQSSPIGRCLQTAEIIADVVGIERDDIVSNRDLGDPGFIINDARSAWTHWQEKGHERVNQHLLSGGEQWEGFKELDHAVKIFDTSIRKQLSKQNEGVHIWITHDTILATYASRIMPTRLKMTQWPRYLDFLALELKNGDFVYKYFNQGADD
ncbi:histidine phosphatase family protein [Marinomonas balearica]|uniref:Broad specificity phosphatase PhoE n=1 Tax=Marinomonas balearica TaxID=491947 RepID=A0A4R6MED7_9GAMM|nr:histidine phosphatase family protein [Marinomonas balearica]TDO99796.1 broad specificity phosphatase PhoE [Marinomonas balearica]